MKLGIVSKPAHAKNHAAALKSDGHKVKILGSDFTTIGSSYDALILRIASCSHGASQLAWEWGRRTDKPVIVEDGLTGIRRELSKLMASNLRQAEQAKSTPRRRVVQKTRPSVVSVSTPGYADGGLGKPPARPPIPDLNAPEPVEETTPHVLWDLQEKSFPNLSWKRGVSFAKLHEAVSWYTKASKNWSKFSEHVASTFVKGIDSNPRTARFKEEDLDANPSFLIGNPTHFAVFLIGSLKMHFPDVQYRQRDIDLAYREFSGKAMQSYSIHAAAWVFGVSPLRRGEAETVNPVLAPKSPPKSPPPVKEPEVAANPTVVPTAAVAAAPSGFPPEALVTHEQLAGIKTELEDVILELMGRVSEAARRAEALESDNAKLRKEMETFKNHSHEFPQSADSSADASLQSLEALAARGADVELRISFKKPS